VVGLRHQHLDVPPDHLLGLIAEDLHRGAIEAADRTVGVDRDQPIDNGIHDGPKRIGIRQKSVRAGHR
jgi:hypothetical protein